MYLLKEYEHDWKHVQIQLYYSNQAEIQNSFATLQIEFTFEYTWRVTAAGLEPNPEYACL